MTDTETIVLIVAVSVMAAGVFTEVLDTLFILIREVRKRLAERKQRL